MKLRIKIGVQSHLQSEISSIWMYEIIYTVKIQVWISTSTEFQWLKCWEHFGATVIL